VRVGVEGSERWKGGGGSELRELLAQILSQNAWGGGDLIYWENK